MYKKREISFRVNLGKTPCNYIHLHRRRDPEIRQRREKCARENHHDYCDQLRDGLRNQGDQK